MNIEEELQYSIALRACPWIGDATLSKLINAMGSAKEVWKATPKVLKEIHQIGEKTIKEIGKSEYLKFAEQELVFCEKNNIHILLKHLEQLPKSLSKCPDAPSILYQKGKVEEDLKFISIVGTRNMTPYGKKFIEEVMDLLKGEKVSIVSGLALGTDGCAHQEALKRGINTIAVLAHGMHTLYPPKHRHMAHEILEQGGALITEFNSSHQPDREHFLQRNRIVAGISRATVVVETAFSGGSMSTVNFANQYNREVYALPGKISDKYSQGCNMIIARNKARIIFSAKDMIEDMEVYIKHEVGQLFHPIEIALPDDLQVVYKEISEQPFISLDDLSLNLAMPTYQVLPLLLKLELSGHIKTHSGRLYSLN